MNRFKRQILLIFFVGLLLLLSVYLWNYLMYGTIKVVAGDQNSIVTISAVKDSGTENKNVFSQTATGSLSVRVSPGEYIISVQGKVLATNKTVSAEAHKTKEYKLVPPEVSPLEPVAGLNGNNLFLGSSRLVYVNANSGWLSYIDSRNNIGILNNTVVFQQVRWSSSETGIGQDDKKQLYAIKNGSFKKLIPPKSSSGSQDINFAISPNGSMYATIGSGLYAVSAAGEFTKIYTSDVASSQLTAGNDYMAIINPARNDTYADKRSGTDNPFVEVVDKSGKSVAKKDIRSTGGSWSPNGSKLLVVDYFGTSGIYDKNLNLQQTLPNNKIGQTYWVDDDTVIYAVDNLVWSYNLSASQSQIVARLEPGNSIKSFFADKKTGYVYLAVNSADKNGLYKFGLRGQSVPDYITTLDVFLPVNLDSCSIDYVNFKSPPAIIMSGPTRNKGICKTQTEIELVQDGFKPSNFRYIFNDLGLGE